MAVARRDAVPPLDERAHEASVDAFLAKVPKRRRERTEGRHSVLTDTKLRQVLKHESSWAGDVLDELVVAVASPVPDFLSPPGGRAESVHRTPGALTGAHHIFTSEIDQSGEST